MSSRTLLYFTETHSISPEPLMGFASLHFVYLSSHLKLNDLRYSVDDDPFEVSAKVVDTLSPKTAEIGGTNACGGASSVEHSFFEKEGTYDNGGDPNRRLCTETSVALTVSEQVDELIDSCIEIESNKRMMKENVNWFTLTFKSNDLESKVTFHIFCLCAKSLNFQIGFELPLYN